MNRDHIVGTTTCTKSTIVGQKSVFIYLCTAFLFVLLWLSPSSFNISLESKTPSSDEEVRGGGVEKAAGGSNPVEQHASCVQDHHQQQQQQQHQQSLIVSSTGGLTRGFHPVFVYSNAQPLRIRSYAQVSQDKIIMELCRLNDEKAASKKTTATEKYFVDLAANDAATFSNTLHLEQNGWTGLCIEPNPRYWYRLAAFRKCTIVGAFVGGTEDGKEVDVILSNHVYGGIVGEGLDNEKKKAEEKRNLVSISTVFKETLVPNIIDYMSLDVEGAESLVMQDFPFDTYKILFLTIERPKDDLKELLEKNGYRTISKDISNFGETLWFHEKSIALTQEEIEQVACNGSYKHCFVPP